MDEATPEAHALGASNLVVIRDGRTIGHNTDWVGFADALLGVPSRRHFGDRMVLLRCGRSGVAVGYGALRYGAAHLDIVDQDVDQAAAVAARLGALIGRTGSPRRRPGARLWSRGGLIQATLVGMDAHPGLPSTRRCCGRTSGWPTSSTSRWRPRLVHRARGRLPGDDRWGLAVHQHAAAFGS